MYCTHYTYSPSSFHITETSRTASMSVEPIDNTIALTAATMKNRHAWTATE